MLWNRTAVSKLPSSETRTHYVLLFSHKGDHACCHLHVPGRFFKGYLSHTHRHNIPCTDISPYHNRHGWLTGLKKNQWPFYRHVKYTFLSTSTTAATTTTWLNRIAQVTYTRTGSWWGETVKSKKSPRNARSRRISSEELTPCWLSLIANSFYAAGQDIQCTRY